MKTKSLLALAFVSSVAFISCSDDGSGIRGCFITIVNLL